MALRRLGKRAARVAAGAGCIGAAGGVILYQTDPSFQRSVRFWQLTGPIVAHYLVERWRAADDADRDARYKRLHAMYAGRARQVVEESCSTFQGENGS
ncbi:unnamed protein product [Effrenium voratum]|uniref:Uncharacterized protein n=1 Tax=Effrenium voratum TaxID=2562239 RepID=A0AA36I9C7_9DINO|nr:unnamed protein product [Effrenium voratum]